MKRIILYSCVIIAIAALIIFLPEIFAGLSSILQGLLGILILFGAFFLLYIAPSLLLGKIRDWLLGPRSR